MDDAKSRAKEAVGDVTADKRVKTEGPSIGEKGS